MKLKAQRIPETLRRSIPVRQRQMTVHTHEDMALPLPRHITDKRAPQP